MRETWPVEKNVKDGSFLVVVSRSFIARPSFFYAAFKGTWRNDEHGMNTRWLAAYRADVHMSQRIWAFRAEINRHLGRKEPYTLILTLFTFSGHARGRTASWALFDIRCAETAGRQSPV